MRRFGPADFRTMPWANGRGATVELYREDGADGLILRLSLATVAEPGPFSALPGLARVLVLIDGPGFTLDIAGLPHPLRPLTPIRFSGGAPAAAREVPGPSRDFNVMRAEALPPAEVRVLTAGQGMTAARVFLFALAPTRITAEGDTVALPAESLAEVAGPAELHAGGPCIGIGLA